MSHGTSSWAETGQDREGKGRRNPGAVSSAEFAGGMVRAGAFNETHSALPRSFGWEEGLEQAKSTLAHHFPACQAPVRNKPQVSAPKEKFSFRISDTPGCESGKIV